MFRFFRTSAYDQEYIQKEIEIIEELLNIKKRLDNLCIEYNDEYASLIANYNSTERLDYTSLALKNNSKRDTKAVIEESIRLKQQALEYLRTKIKQKFIEIWHYELKNTDSPYHKIFYNIWSAEKINFESAYDLYTDLKNVEFPLDVTYLEQYLLKLKLIQSNLVTKEREIASRRF